MCPSRLRPDDPDLLDQCSTASEGLGSLPIGAIRRWRHARRRTDEPDREPFGPLRWRSLKFPGVERSLGRFPPNRTPSQRAHHSRRQDSLIVKNPRPSEGTSLVPRTEALLTSTGASNHSGTLASLDFWGGRGWICDRVEARGGP